MVSARPFDANSCGAGEHWSYLQTVESTAFTATASPYNHQRIARAGRVLRLSLLCLFAAIGCNRENSLIDTSGPQSSNADASRELGAVGHEVKPPFAVSGELEGLLMVWFDAQGIHTAQKRSEIPEQRRTHVRVDALTLGPDQQLDPEHIYLADLRTAGADGSYPVRVVPRLWFDAQVDRASQAQLAVAAPQVTVYMASWCGVCRSAAAFLRSQHVDFVEKDVEKEPGASQEMLQKARAKGLTPRGVPVIDFHGEIMLGFDRAHVKELIDRYAKPI